MLDSTKKNCRFHPETWAFFEHLPQESLHGIRSNNFLERWNRTMKSVVDGKNLGLVAVAKEISTFLSFWKNETERIRSGAATIRKSKISFKYLLTLKEQPSGIRTIRGVTVARKRKSSGWKSTKNQLDQEEVGMESEEQEEEEEQQEEEQEEEGEGEQEEQSKSEENEQSEPEEASEEKMDQKKRSRSSNFQLIVEQAKKEASRK